MRSYLPLLLRPGVLAWLMLLPWAANCEARIPLHGSETSIEKYLLRQAPLGSTMDQVLTMLEHQRVEGTEVSRDHGFLDGRVRPERMTGAMSIRANVGHTRFIFRTDVIARWAFDSNGRLTDVWVNRETDSL